MVVLGRELCLDARPEREVAIAELANAHRCGVDQSGVIRVHTLTEATGDDATTALDLLTAVEGALVSVTADAACGWRIANRPHDPGRYHVL